MIAPHDLKLFHEPLDRLRLTIGEDRSYATVRPAWAAPLSQTGRYLSLMDAKGHEIVMVPDAADLDRESLAAVKKELARRYLTATIERIDLAKVEFGSTYWHVETERGKRDFVTQSLQENAQWLSEHHLLLIDVDGNRFEIPDIRVLDGPSRHYIASIL